MYHCIVGTGVVNTFLRAANYRIHGNNLCMRQRRRLGRYYTVVAFFCFVLVQYCKNRKKNQGRNRASSSRSVVASHTYHFCIPPPTVQPISY